MGGETARVYCGSKGADMKTRVINFFCRNGTDSTGRTLEEMIALSDRELEHHHDIIQWMFPLHEASNFNSDCPLIDTKSATMLRTDPVALQRMRDGLERFARFLGFQRDETGHFVSDPTLAKNRANWQTPLNHNHLRITRIIRSLRLFGLETEARDFFNAVHESASNSGCLSEQTEAYWRRALERPPFETLR